MHTNFSTYNIILKILFWSGINVYKEKNQINSSIIFRLRFAAPIFLYLSYIDYWVMSYRNLTYEWQEYQVVISYVASNTLCLLLWHILFIRKKNIKTLLKRIELACNDILVDKPQKMSTNISIFFVTIFIPILYSCISVFLMSHEDSNHYYTFFTYGHKMKEFTLTLKIYLFLKTVISVMLDPMFTSIVTVLYCTLCHRCYLLLHECYHRFAKILHNNSEPTSSVYVIQATKDYSKIIQILECLQAVFSLPTFFLVLVDFLSSFSTLASVLTVKLEERAPADTAENAFVFVYSVLLLAATIGYAAQIPIAESRIHNCFQRLNEKILWRRYDGVVEKSDILPIKVVRERPIFVLSGCDIIYFKRGAVLTVL